MNYQLPQPFLKLRNALCGPEMLLFDTKQMNAAFEAGRASREAEVEALKADAERYQAIRNGIEIEPNNSGIVVSLVDDFGGETLKGERADEAIDAAIAAQEETND